MASTPIQHHAHDVNKENYSSTPSTPTSVIRPRALLSSLTTQSPSPTLSGIEFSFKPIPPPSVIHSSHPIISASLLDRSPSPCKARVLDPERWRGQSTSLEEETHDHVLSTEEDEEAQDGGDKGGSSRSKADHVLEEEQERAETQEGDWEDEEEEEGNSSTDLDTEDEDEDVELNSRQNQSLDILEDVPEDLKPHRDLEAEDLTGEVMAPAVQEEEAGESVGAKPKLAASEELADESTVEVPSEDASEADSVVEEEEPIQTVLMESKTRDELVDYRSATTSLDVEDDSVEVQDQEVEAVEEDWDPIDEISEQVLESAERRVEEEIAATDNGVDDLVDLESILEPVEDILKVPSLGVEVEKIEELIPDPNVVDNTGDFILETPQAETEEDDVPEDENEDVDEEETYVQEAVSTSSPELFVPVESDSELKSDVVEIPTLSPLRPSVPQLSTTSPTPPSLTPPRSLTPKTPSLSLGSTPTGSTPSNRSQVYEAPTTKRQFTKQMLKMTKPRSVVAPPPPSSSSLLKSSPVKLPPTSPAKPLTSPIKSRPLPPPPPTATAPTSRVPTKSESLPTINRIPRPVSRLPIVSGSRPPPSSQLGETSSAPELLPARPGSVASQASTNSSSSTNGATSGGARGLPVAVQRSKPIGNESASASASGRLVSSATGTTRAVQATYGRSVSRPLTSSTSAGVSRTETTVAGAKKVTSRTTLRTTTEVTTSSTRVPPSSTLTRPTASTVKPTLARPTASAPAPPTTATPASPAKPLPSVPAAEALPSALSAPPERIPSTLAANLFGSSSAAVETKSASTRPKRSRMPSEDEVIPPPPETASSSSPVVSEPSRGRSLTRRHYTAAPSLTPSELSALTQKNSKRNRIYYNKLDIQTVYMNTDRPPSPTSKIRRSLDTEGSSGKPSTDEGRAARAAKRRTALRSSTDGSELALMREELESGEEGETKEKEKEKEVVKPLVHFRAAGDEEQYRSPARATKGKKVSGGGVGGSSEESRRTVKWDKALVFLGPLPPTGQTDGIVKDVPLDKFGNVVSHSTMAKPASVVVRMRVFLNDPVEA